MPEEKKQVNFQIQLDEQIAQGAYVNLAMINHSETEFVIDFIYLQPQAPQGKVRARIITSPNHCKRLIAALQDNMKKYEERFGEVKVAPMPPEGIGIYH